MINHARTLLLNIDGGLKPDPSYPGEEYVPNEFKSISLPQGLADIRNTIFSPGADRAMLNYRLRQYLTLIHSTPELEPYILDLDSRITYWPLYDESMFDVSFQGAIVSLLSGSDDWGLVVQNNPDGVTSSSRLADIWTVQIIDINHAKTTHMLPGNEVVTTTMTITNNSSQPISLPGSPLNYILFPGSGSFPTWQVETVARPTLNISDIYLNLKNVVNNNSSILFNTSKEPYETLYKVWAVQNGPIAYKLGAAIVALIYRLDEIYNTGHLS